jgi:hypothetical protein
MLLKELINLDHFRTKQVYGSFDFPQNLRALSAADQQTNFWPPPWVLTILRNVGGELIVRANISGILLVDLI